MTSRNENRLPDGDFARWNEEMVARYDIDRYYTGSHWIVRRIERGRIAAVERLAAAQPGDRVLEVGCGGGHVLARFAQARRMGIDLSPAMLARTRRRHAQAVPLVQATAEGLPVRSGSQDVVLCTEVLEHTRDPAQVIAELMRVVRPEGRVVVSVPNEGNIDRAKRLLRATPVLRTVLRTLAQEANEWHLHTFDLRMLHELCAGRAFVEAIVSVPLPGLAVRYVALLRPSSRERRSP